MCKQQERSQARAATRSAVGTCSGSARPQVGRKLASSQLDRPTHQAAHGRGRDSQKRIFEPFHAKCVPKAENLKATIVEESPCDSSNATTMMLRNIPNKYTQNTMIEEINSMGFAGTYDFFYLPMDVHNRGNVGYAFMNFTLPADARRFQVDFKEHRFRQHQSRKIGSVSVAYVQGLSANLGHFANRAVVHARNDQYRPVVFKDGVRVDFEQAVAEAVGSPESRTACGSPATSSAPRSEREELEEAVRNQLKTMSRQNSAGSATTSTSLPPPPPGFEGIWAAPAAVTLARQQSAPASFPDGTARVVWSSAGAPQASSSALRPASADNSPSLSFADGPAYVPLPSIPSASKLFSGLDLNDLECEDGFTATWRCSGVALA
mmetsp:Transcript_121748/g.351530  ORF Transcript_121748/g.351530 Transcript_121748/m.351530 type:complete len:378 (+) Transcript_121748:120-1253(+)